MEPLTAAEGLKPGTVAVIGLPSDENSSFLKGPAEAPGRIREALGCGSMNLFSETGANLENHPRFKDLGNISPGGFPPDFKQIRRTIEGLLAKGLRVLSIGGDHAVTIPILQAYGQRYGALTVIQLDAHPDLYETFGGSPTSHACVFSRVMEENRISRLLQIGTRTWNPHQRQQAARFGVVSFDMRRRPEPSDLQVDGPVYLTVDMDVLDPAFAPGVSHPEPGGMSSRDVIDMIQSLPAGIVGADLVEYNPRRDVNGLTAMVGAKLLKEIAGKLLESP